MIEITKFGDVQRLRMWTLRSRWVGYDVSAYLVRGMLVDTGMRHCEQDLLSVLEDLRPRAVIVTHWHEDHAGNAAVLAEQYPTLMSDYTQRKLRERQQVKFYRHFTWGRPKKLIAPLQPFDPTPLLLVPTPGHSPDHHVVFDPQTATLFSADLWLGVKVRVMGALENPYEIIDSLTTAIALNPIRMFDSHRGLVENPVGILTAKRAWLLDTCSEIERRLAAGQGDSQILNEVLDGEERTAYVSQGEYSRRNLVRIVKKYSPMHR
jgi:glyoxylase-like metal-dependent hydrolase (beta-lactamase superfamily II)